MGKQKDQGSILAANLARYMKLKGVSSEPALEKLSGVSQKTINNILNKRHDPYFSSVNKLAAALGIETYQLLCSVEDEAFLAISLLWAQSDERGRADLFEIAQAILARRNNDGKRDRGAEGEREPIGQRR